MPERKNVVEDIAQRDMTLLYRLRFWALTLLRIHLGILFTYHGSLRLLEPNNLAGSIAYFSQAGIPYAQYSVYLFGIIEMAGGLLLLFGLFTRGAAFIVMLEMIYVLLKAHLKNGFLVSSNGYEFALILIFALLFVLVNGSGHLSLGKMLRGE